MPATQTKPTVPTKRNWMLWGAIILIALLGLVFVFGQIQTTAAGLVGGGSISTASGAKQLQNDLTKLGMENVRVQTQGKTTTIEFKVPENPETLMDDKLLLAQIGLKLNEISDDQKLEIKPEGYAEAYVISGKHAKELMAAAVTSGGNPDPELIAQYVQTVPQ